MATRFSQIARLEHPLASLGHRRPAPARDHVTRTSGARLRLNPVAAQDPPRGGSHGIVGWATSQACIARVTEKLLK